MFSFDGECVYGDLRCLRYKMNMPEEKQKRISSYFFLQCKHDISDVKLWKNAMLILLFVHDTCSKFNKCVSCQIFS